jgi:hypothetical protein
MTFESASNPIRGMRQKCGTGTSSAAGLNPAELILVKQCATTALACEKLQERMLDEADDAAVDKAIVPLSNALVRLQAALSAGKKRRAEKPRLPAGTYRDGD